MIIEGDSLKGDPASTRAWWNRVLVADWKTFTRSRLDARTEAKGSSLGSACTHIYDLGGGASFRNVPVADVDETNDCMLFRRVFRRGVAPVSEDDAFYPCQAMDLAASSCETALGRGCVFRSLRGFQGGVVGVFVVKGALAFCQAAWGRNWLLGLPLRLGLNLSLRVSDVHNLRFGRIQEWRKVILALFDAVLGSDHDFIPIGP